MSVSVNKQNLSVRINVNVYMIDLQNGRLQFLSCLENDAGGLAKHVVYPNLFVVPGVFEEGWG